MGYLETPYRAVYESKNFVTGLTNVVGFVMKPNGSVAGPFAMTEMAAPFLGRYYFDYFTSALDPEGEYFALTWSPTDGIQDTLRMSIYKNPVTEINATLSGLLVQLAAMNVGVDIQGMIEDAEDGEELFGFVEDDNDIEVIGFVD